MEVRPTTGNLSRLLKLWRLHAQMDLIWMMRDLRSFLMYSGSDLLITAAGVTAMLLLAARFDGIGPWSRLQVVFLLSYATLVRGLLDIFFNYNVLFISRRVGRGQLDHTLVQPQPLWLSLLTEGFTPFSGSAALLPGLGLLFWSLRGLSLSVSPQWVAWLLLNLIGSAALTTAVSYLTGSLAFWAPRAGEEVCTSTMGLFNELKVFPLDGLSGATRLGLLSVLPVGFAAWYPARALLRLGGPWWALGATPLVALLASLLAAWAFRRGLAHYGRTGSQRYSLFGHRR